MKHPGDQLKSLLQCLESETVPFEWHSDPKAINDCWRHAHDLIEDLLNENQKLKKKADVYNQIIAIMDKYYETDKNGEFINGEGDLMQIGEAIALKLGYM